VAPSKADALLEQLRGAGLSVAVAESLTGGMLASELAAVPGASDTFLGGVVAYSNTIKKNILGVSSDALDRLGAVSEAVALQMALGAQKSFAAASGLTANDVVGVATTGVAGPTESEGKKVGTVFIAACLGDLSQVQSYQFHGDRQQIRIASSEAAIALVEEFLKSAP
jgi:nicotinamide-nucleotide amidase